MEVSDFVRVLLSKRGITTDGDVASFLSPDYAAHTHSPMLLLGMDIAVERVLKAIEVGERIAIYADFDCDGIPGAAVLSDFFNKVAYGNFEVYVPHRDREGYGFHTEAIGELAARDVKLIITVDVGMTAVNAVAFARGIDVDVIVTDHHPPSLKLRRAGEITEQYDLPDAVAILNPKLGAYPFRDMCGAAVAFKLVQATLAEGKKRNLVAFLEVPVGWEKWLLDLVGIATVADMVPLVGENRTLAHFGLSVLRKSRRPGVVALCKALRLRQHELTEDDIGFSIAPRVNAASRMGEPDTALRLLTTRDSMEAERLAAHLEELNVSRKSAVGVMVRQARKNVATRFTSEDRVIVVGNPEWKPALCGLAANSILGERSGVVCVWGRDALGRLKGSCRSDGSVSLIELFGNGRDLFEAAGGHERSGGFSVSHEKVHTLPEMLKLAADTLTLRERDPIREPDAHITLPEISPRLFSEVSRLAPFGIGNPKPVFLVTRSLITSVKRFGKENNHVELQLACTESGASARAFAFFKSPEDFSHVPSVSANASVLATVERDSFRGGLALRLIDVLPV
ncbi:MAG: single-stranded-DNA-specific exonuclease RecJ [bacterium]|nr:single-stranded-DNA-specific exonuclease RecJ [bacterium]